MRAFIESAKGSCKRSRYDERTLELKSEFEINGRYPFAYGFLPATNGAGGDCVDCYVISDDDLESGATVDCEPEFALEVFEGEETDHKIVMVHGGRVAVDVEATANVIKAFILGVFERFPDVKITFGRVLSKPETIAFLASRTKA